jgi:glucokinase
MTDGPRSRAKAVMWIRPSSTIWKRRVMRILRAEQGHVTAECVLSGPGLSRLHRSLAAALDQPVTARSAAEICAARTDPLCHQTLRMFCALLGSFSGNVALTLGARSGVWLGGGVLPRIADALQDSDFRARFEAKFRMADYVRDISTRLITSPTPALIGAGVWLDQSIHATSALFTPAVSDDRRSSAKPS